MGQASRSSFAGRFFLAVALEVALRKAARAAASSEGSSEVDGATPTMAHSCGRWQRPRFLPTRPFPRVAGLRPVSPRASMWPEGVRRGRMGARGLASEATRHCFCRLLLVTQTCPDPACPTHSTRAWMLRGRGPRDRLGGQLPHRRGTEFRVCSICT